jgi:transcriptional regulator with XRE-family HTH domain
MTIHARIKELRKAFKLSQVKFSKEIYISNGYLAELELGHRPVNERLIQLISTTFGANKQWLLSGEGTMLNETPEGKLETIINGFKSLKPEFQDYVLSQIDQLIVLQNKDSEKR